MKAALIALLVLVLTATVVEAKPYVPTTLSLDQSAPIFHGDTLTFTYSVSKPIKDTHCTQLGRCPSIQVLCSQVGNPISPMWAEIKPAWSASFHLLTGFHPDGTPFWDMSKVATCTATLFDYRNDPSQWAQVTFEALP